MQVQLDHRDSGVQGKLTFTQEQVRQDSLRDLVLMNPKEIADSMLSDTKLLHQVEDVVGLIQSKLGAIDDISLAIEKMKNVIAIGEQPEKEKLTKKQIKEKKVEE